MNEFKVGDRAVVKVGRNEINVEILAVEEKSYLVRNNAGKEFHAVRLTALPDAKGVGNTDTLAAEPEKKRSRDSSPAATPSKKSSGRNDNVNFSSNRNQTAGRHGQCYPAQLGRLCRPRRYDPRRMVQKR